MYAFVAMDIMSGEFLAARDPFGVKPLYVIQSGDGFLFCSEMKPLLETVPIGDVLLVPPGYMVSAKGCGRYKSPVYPRTDLPVQNDPDALDAILAEAVRVRLPPDLPVATLFSGGIDSTLVAHYVRRHRSDAPDYSSVAPKRRTTPSPPNMPIGSVSICAWFRFGGERRRLLADRAGCRGYRVHSNQTWFGVPSAL